MTTDSQHPDTSADLVSVIIPTYNRLKYLPETVNSVRAQTYPHWQLLIVDDGSTDDTRAWFDSTQKQNPDPRIRYLHQPNRGAPAARNHGFHASTGRYIQFLDSDDLLHPDKLALQVHALRSSSADIAFGPWHIFRDTPHPRTCSERFNNQPVPDHDFLAAELRGWHPAPACYLYHRRVVEHVGPWDEQLAQNQDVDFIFRVALYGYNPTFVPASLTYQRYHDDNRISGTLNPATRRSRQRTFDKLLHALREKNLYEKYRPHLACYCQIQAGAVVLQDQAYARHWLDLARDLGRASLPLRKKPYVWLWRCLGPLRCARLMRILKRN